MALAEDLVKVGINARHAQAIGLHYEFLTAVGTVAATAPKITESITYALPSVGNDSIKLPTTDASKTGFHIIASTGPVPLVVHTSGTEFVLPFGTGAPLPANSFSIPAYSWAIVTKLDEAVWGAMIK